MRSLGTFQRYYPSQPRDPTTPGDPQYFKNERDEDFYDLVEQADIGTSVVGVREDNIVVTATNDLSTLYPVGLTLWVLDTRHDDTESLYGQPLDDLT